ncbi:MAG: cytochrome c nitrite reductase small subunit [Bacteroidales bacterium]|jgi:cytochrome c nitrite reductase small subunit|nr:cytochrome c nitrite reductase small subunit [Bacteroidales bacterium]
MSNILKAILPPREWHLPVAIVAGALFGLVLFLFYISNAGSYLSNDPKTCINCHVMNYEYITWFHSSHREKASCNDCHVPHDNVFNTYFFKAKDGLRHATVFTLRQEPQVIRIKEEGAKVVQENCIRCHNELITDRKILSYTKAFDHFRTEGRQCWECHREVPHGRLNSLSAAPNALIPETKNPIPEWINNMFK